MTGTLSAGRQALALVDTANLIYFCSFDPTCHDPSSAPSCQYSGVCSSDWLRQDDSSPTAGRRALRLDLRKTKFIPTHWRQDSVREEVSHFLLSELSIPTIYLITMCYRQV